jgi:hypothetical protein
MRDFMIGAPVPLRAVRVAILFSSRNSHATKAGHPRCCESGVSFFDRLSGGEICCDSPSDQTRKRGNLNHLQEAP